MFLLLTGHISGGCKDFSFRQRECIIHVDWGFQLQCLHLLQSTQISLLITHGTQSLDRHNLLPDRHAQFLGLTDKPTMTASKLIVKVECIQLVEAGTDFAQVANYTLND